MIAPLYVGTNVLNLRISRSNNRPERGDHTEKDATTKTETVTPPAGWPCSLSFYLVIVIAV